MLHYHVIKVKLRVNFSYFHEYTLYKNKNIFS